jgi:hypothetical protein
MTDLALKGTRIIDLSQGIAGPYCTRLPFVIPSADPFGRGRTLLREGIWGPGRWVRSPLA